MEKIENYCMADLPSGFQCGEIATRFEHDPNHWHDWIWCEEHAKDRNTESLLEE